MLLSSQQICLTDVPEEFNDFLDRGQTNIIDLIDSFSR